MTRFFASLSLSHARLGQPHRQCSVLCILVMFVAMQLVSSASSDTVRLSQSEVEAKIPPFHKIREEIEAELCLEKRNLVDWAVELLEKNPKDVKEALVKIEVMLRAGLDDHAAETVTQLLPLYCDPNHRNAVGNSRMLFYVACRKFQGPQTINALLDTFPEHIDTSSMSSVSMLLCQFRNNGWKQEQIEQWLITMQKKSFQKRRLIPLAQANSRDKHFRYQSEPWYLEHENRPETTWLKIRLGTGMANEKKMQLLDQLEQAARQNPADTLGMLDFIFVWQSTRTRINTVGQNGSELSWIVEVAKPKETLDAYYLGIDLLKAKQWEPAKQMFQKALSLSENSKEESPQDPTQTLMMARRKGRTYKDSIARMIEQCDQNIKQSSPVKPTSYSSPLLSTSTTSASTSNPTQDEVAKTKNKQQEASLTEIRASVKKEEERLLQEEEKMKAVPSYWERRANLYLKIPHYRRTKEECQKEEDALKMALKLIKEPTSELQSKGPRQRRPRKSHRSELVQRYVDSLRNQMQDRTRDEFNFLLTELENNPPESDSARTAARCLNNKNKYLPFLKPNEPIIWNWIEKQEVWGNDVRTLLYFMACKVREGFDKQLSSPQNNEASEDVYTFIKKLEEMAKHGHLSRVKLCVDFLLGSSSLGLQANPERAFLLIQDRLKRGDLDATQQATLASDLFLAYVKGKYFEEADQLFENEDYQLRDRGRYCQLALDSAKANNKQIAMKNWRRSANCALRDERQVELNRMLRQYDLGDQIDAYYQEVKKKLPDFEVPVPRKFHPQFLINSKEDVVVKFQGKA